MSEAEESNFPFYKWCWGTIHPHEGVGWSPLVVEMMTAASAMLELWEQVLDTQQRADLLRALTGRNEDETRLVAAFLAGMSRLGLASPSQLVWPDAGQRSSRLLNQACTRWREQALQAGLPLSQADSRTRHAESEHITAAVLPRLIGCDCPGYVDGERCREPDHQGLYDVAYALNRRGADVLHADAVAVAHRATGGSAWNAVRVALVGAVARHVDIGAGSLPGILAINDPTGLIAFGRLIAQCTALSLRRTRGIASPEDSWEAMSDRARLQARDAVQCMRIGYR